ncbi:Gfo/Idh/MocA family protein [Cyclobacterium qasimii]|uniref:Myo-inositol 2-dehydrogenase n=2 Tax=Cyclobacterium qasimii TaxID=1350429 RepID=S7WLY4_9BACT|nr:Gfo/Idh/MocA family oxidoreductase [Cyclobacterium qasimii]EPR67739.1 Myo-inositol 2-dehydrogenase [Cyclobacterium qasimii M12-11B]GEO20341.1 NADH-dependent dehydrogenase [Cyclobacterium qasimii]
MKQSRRAFLKNSTLTVAGMGLIHPNSFATPKFSANDKINIGLIGAKNKGFNILSHLMKTGQVNCLGICDVDKNILENRIADVRKEFGQIPKGYGDFRKLLENDEIDAVIIGTPDHWHCLMMVYACQAGKDVYVEKPLANSIAECNVMVDAANKYNSVVQVGQQQRSGEVWNSAMQHIHAGGIGEIKKVNVWANFPYGMGSGKVPDQPVPEELDYAFWQGPAAKRAYNPSHVHGSWRHFWDYGGGLMTDWGVHLLDMALWAKNISHEPRTVLASGANYNMDAYSRETYEVMDVNYPMDDYMIHWSHTAGIQTGPYDKAYGVEFIGDNGVILADRGDWSIRQGDKGESEQATKTAKEGFNFGGKSDMEIHVLDFLHCIRNRNATKCTVEMGRNVALYAHMGNIAVRSGTHMLDWNEVAGSFDGNKAANQFIIPNYDGPWELPKI